ncbi:DUF4158 domain-containing protein [Streptomyces sp. NBC_01433]|uniref:DUF4158 domain-containing protein n=1 Tax=Streptomyces sp. NBC_01433 TaxID=2903864 RepID=UPI00224F2DFE|nr:DUF4158 domain-containing protein [Streptomyces sp. NBC_01433]MCX4679424.1 DUF4158 domain-containing protein [Streptomyces sp. NBC_01433]
MGFALLLKFFEVEARFPESAKEMPAAAVEYVAQQVKVPAETWADYDWQDDRIKRHRKEIREAYGIRANTEEDQKQLAEWLAAELCPVELSRERLAAAVVARCRNDSIEPPAPGRVGRLIGKAVKDSRRGNRFRTALPRERLHSEEGCGFGVDGPGESVVQGQA